MLTWKHSLRDVPEQRRMFSEEEPTIDLASELTTRVSAAHGRSALID